MSIPIREKITLNHFALPRDEKVNKSRKTHVDKLLNTDFFMKMQSVMVHRRSEAKDIFTTEIFGTAQNLSVSDTVAYHGFKSTLLQRFVECAKPAITASSALLFEVSPLMRD